MPQATTCDDRFGDKSISSHRHDMQTTARGIRHIVRRLTRRQSTAATNLCKRFVRNQKSLGHTHPTSSLSQSHCPISLHIQTFAMSCSTNLYTKIRNSFSVHEHCPVPRSRHVFFINYERVWWCCCRRVFLVLCIATQKQHSPSILSAVDVSLRCFESKEQRTAGAAYTDAAPV